MLRLVRAAMAALIILSTLVAAHLQAGAAPVRTGAISPAGWDRDAGFNAAVRRLRADADSPVRLHRTERGTVDFAGSLVGGGVENPERAQTAGPVESAREHLDRYGAMFGVSSARADLSVAGHGPSDAGGSLVRFQQHLLGLPVVGGELVVSLDSSGDLTSVLAETTTETETGPGTAVSEREARSSAVEAVARAHELAKVDLTVDRGEEWFYDPSLVDAVDRLGARTVWRFEVGNGYDVRELVLVDATTGRVALHFNQVAEALDRVVCDQNNVRRAATNCTVNQARTETGSRSAVADVNSAFDLTGAAAQMYADVGDIDLTELIGLGPTGSRKLASTVRWCDTVDRDPTCPMQNAFWSGRQMFYGEGFALADDVVGHELTHGVIDRNSSLFYFHQSGAINESIADIMGEILDHRHVSGSDTPSDWDLGEDLSIGTLRNLAEPPTYGQPDRMTSALYARDLSLFDNGGVHTNSGVGNKTAYLISQGGAFNGVSVGGIDGDDVGLTKTATLYLEVIRRLTSGSDYADLGRVLVQSCRELAVAATAGFTTDDCANVARATRATGLARQPAVAGAAAPEAPSGCPTGTSKKRLFTEDVDPTTNDWGYGPLWGQAPDPVAGVPSYATSGRRSFFGWNPDPALDDRSSSAVSMLEQVRLPAGQKSYLHFRHAYLFDSGPIPGQHSDGGFVNRRRGTSGWTSASGLPWVNGPTDRIRGSFPSPRAGFGGISNGYVSSRVDLTSLGGQRIAFQWQVAGDATGSLIGWFVDDIEIYTCAKALASRPRRVTARGLPYGVILDWAAPNQRGSGVTGYRITRSDGVTRKVAPANTSARFHGLKPRTSYTFRVRALDKAGRAGAAGTVTARATTVRFKATAVEYPGGYDTLLAGRVVKARTPLGLGRRWVHVQQRGAGAVRWHGLGRLRTRADGTFTMRLANTSSKSYRVVFSGARKLIGSRSAASRVPRP